MYDVSSLKAQVDLLALIQPDTQLRKESTSEWAGPCPFCGGEDRLHVQPNTGRWFCRNCTGVPGAGGRWHDAIAYVQRRDNVSFLQACRTLGAEEVSTLPPPLPTAQSSRRSKPPPTAWQEQALTIIADCGPRLWGPQGEKARAYLHKRGLEDRSLALWDLGFNHTDRFINGLWVPRGITIPCIIHSTVWYLRVRRAQGDPKYRYVKGSHTALFGAQTLREAHTGLLVEGEFDAMLAYQEWAYDTPGAGVATFGSASFRLDATWARYMVPVPRFLVTFDSDKAGSASACALAAASERMHRVTVPNGHIDVTDFHVAGGNIRDWLERELGRPEIPDQEFSRETRGMRPMVSLAARAA